MSVNVVLRKNDIQPEDRGTFTGDHGVVSFAIYDDWVHFRLNDWDAPFPQRWHGFDHWKQNFHTFATQLKLRERSGMIPFWHAELNRLIRRLKG